MTGDEKVNLDNEENLGNKEQEEKQEETKTDKVKVIETNDTIEIKDEVQVDEKEKRKGSLQVAKENKPIKEKDSKAANFKKVHIIIIVAACIFALFLLFAVIVCINKLNAKVYKNVYLNGEDLSGKTKEEVENIITKQNEELVSKK